MTNQRKIAGFDTETNGLTFMADGIDPVNDVACATFYLPDLDKEIFLPLNMVDLSDEMRTKALHHLNMIIDNYALVGFNLAFDVQQLYKLGISEDRIKIAGDAQIFAHMTQQRRKNLKDLCIHFEIISEEESLKFKDLKVPDYDSTKMSIYDSEFVKYAVKDAKIAYRLEKLFRERYVSFTPQYEDELDLIHIFARMQTNGMLVDFNNFLTWRIEFNKNVANLKADLDSTVGFNFRINSRKDKETAFDMLGIPYPTQKTKSGATSYSMEALQPLKKYPFVQKIFDVARDFDIQSTLNSIEKYFPVNIPQFPILHPSYKFVGEDGTSRVYTSQPSANSLPMEFREFIVAAKGKKFLYFDWSGAELVLAATWAGEKWITDLSEKSEDLHKHMAAKLLGRDPLTLSPEDREVSKVVVFSVMFGSEGGAAARKLGCSFEEGSKLVGKFWEICPNIKALRAQLIAQAMKTGYTKTITGRKRRLPKLYSQEQTEKDAAIRQVFNTAIQSSVADLQKMMLKKIHHGALDFENRILTTVFDSFTLEVDESLDYNFAKDAINEISEFEPEPVPGMKIPVKFGFKMKFGSNYREASN
jgi:DNA polymerase I-like protein with 3'-5' exonuclease and polymerase domains